MLTNEQLKELEPLTKHPKFGKLLSDVIEVWKKEDVFPVHGDFGLNFNSNSEVFSLDKHKGCCLLGASLVNSPILKIGCWITSSLKNRYCISGYDINSIWRGFDNRQSNYSDAYDFGLQIRKIVNPYAWYELI